MIGLKRCREAAGLTQAELGRRLGITRAAVYCWESGTNWPSAYWLPLISEILGCSIDELFKE